MVARSVLTDHSPPVIDPAPFGQLLSRRAWLLSASVLDDVLMICLSLICFRPTILGTAPKGLTMRLILMRAFGILILQMVF